MPPMSGNLFNIFNMLNAVPVYPPSDAEDDIILEKKQENKEQEEKELNSIDIFNFLKNNRITITI